MKRRIKEEWLKSTRKDKTILICALLLLVGTMLFVSTFIGWVTANSGKGTFFSGFITGIVMCVVIGVFSASLELLKMKLGKKFPEGE